VKYHSHFTISVSQKKGMFSSYIYSTASIPSPLPTIILNIMKPDLQYLDKWIHYS